MYKPCPFCAQKVFDVSTLVTANQEQFLATITQLDPVYVDMQQSGEVAIGLRARMIGKDSIPVTITLTEKADVQYGETGTLKFSEVTVNETTGSIALRALMPNPDGLLAFNQNSVSCDV